MSFNFTKIIARANPEPEAPVAGPGQNVIVPRRGKGILQQLQPGMRTPMCGACDSQIRCEDVSKFQRIWTCEIQQFGVSILLHFIVMPFCTMHLRSSLF